MNYAAGYGMAFMSYIQFYYTCETGTLIEVNVKSSFDFVVNFF